MKKKSSKNIRTAFLLNLFFSIIEIIGGLYTNSIAIIADALHDFGDSLSIGISWLLEKKSERKPDRSYTYGYGRFSVLGALISTMFLLVSSAAVIFIAVPRIFNPAEVDYNGVIILAVLGVLINGLAVYKTSNGRSLNEKSINLHLLEDLFGWSAVFITSIIMKIFNVPLLDPILSILITIVILFGVIRNLKKIFEVFLEKAPPTINTSDLENHLLQNKNIKGIHHLHIWTIDGVNNYVTLHVVISDNLDANIISRIKKYIREEMREHRIHHSTIEIEFENEECGNYECEVDINSDNHFGHNH